MSVTTPRTRCSLESSTTISCAAPRPRMAMMQAVPTAPAPMTPIFIAISAVMTGGSYTIVMVSSHEKLSFSLQHGRLGRCFQSRAVSITEDCPPNGAPPDCGIRIRMRLMFCRLLREEHLRQHVVERQNQDRGADHGGGRR